MAQTKSVLGRGLSALIPGAGGETSSMPSPRPTETQATQEQTNERIPGVSLLLLDDIEVNPFQPRREFGTEEIEELSKSIKENGLIQPIIVRKNQNGRGYQLVAGERRLRASKLAGLRTVPVVIRKATDRESLELAIVENIQRKDLNVVDLAMAYQQLIDEFSLTQEELADRMGKDRASVANTVRVLKLSESVKSDLRAERMSFGHAKILLSLEDSDQRERVRKEIHEKGLSVRQVEELVRELKAKSEENEKAGGSDSSEIPLTTPTQNRLYSLSHELTKKYSKKVEVKGAANKGKLVLHYSSPEELEQWLNVLQNQMVWPNRQI